MTQMTLVLVVDEDGDTTCHEVSSTDSLRTNTRLMKKVVDENALLFFTAENKMFQAEVEELTDDDEEGNELPVEYEITWHFVEVTPLV